MPHARRLRISCLQGVDQGAGSTSRLTGHGAPLPPQPLALVDPSSRADRAARTRRLWDMTTIRGAASPADDGGDPRRPRSILRSRARLLAVAALAGAVAAIGVAVHKLTASSPT